MLFANSTQSSAVTTPPTDFRRSDGHGKESLARLHGRGFFCRARLFHWNADAVPPCRRKAATKGRRLLCAAADASLLYSTASASGWKRLPSPGWALGTLNQANAGRTAPPGRGQGVVGSAGCQPHGDHTMTDRVFLALALALVVLIASVGVHFLSTRGGKRKAPAPSV